MFVFDIETGPLDLNYVLSMHDVFPPFFPPQPFNPADVKTGNLKDQAKIDAKIAEAREEHERRAAAALPAWEAEREAYHAKIINDAALSPLTGRVLCIGYWHRDGGVFIDDSPDEADLLTGFWDLWIDHKSSRVIGFNIFHFDLPFLVRRSWVHGIKPPRDVRVTYWHESFHDLAHHYALGNRDHRISLDRLSKFLLNKGKERTGEAFHRLWEHDRATAEEYVKNDVYLTLNLAEKMGVLKRWD